MAWYQQKWSVPQAQTVIRGTKLWVYFPATMYLNIEVTDNENSEIFLNNANRLLTR